MGKHEPMTAKAIGIRIKAKGLQKTKYFCSICSKQCRDHNGLKCHEMSESHQRQALIVSENPDPIVDENSKQFTDTFMSILRTRYKTKKVLANTVYQEQIKDKEHVHLNGTRWTTLTDFANWLDENGLVKIEDSERGVMITYVDRDPGTLRRQEIEARRAQMAKEAAIKKQKEIEAQREATKKLYEEIERERPHAAPVPIVKIAVCENEEKATCSTSKNHVSDDESDNSLKEAQSIDDNTPVIERPVFGVGTISLKTATTSATGYKPPKRKVLKKPGLMKRVKTS